VTLTDNTMVKYPRPLRQFPAVNDLAEVAGRVVSIAGVLLAILAFGILTGPRVQAATPPYAGVAWTTFHYPGLNCADDTGNVPSSSQLVLETVKQVEVSNRPTPLALVEVSCNLNHAYFNLFAFSPGTNPSQPQLLQALAVDQGTQQDAWLATSKNSITATLAGYTSHEALCCPSVITKQQWLWNGSEFVERPAVKVQRIAMPNLVGKTYGTATRELSQVGIAFFDNLSGHLKVQSVVRAQSPPAGTILRPPKVRVSLTTR